MKNLKTLLLAMTIVLSITAAEAKIFSVGVYAGSSNSRYSIKDYDSIENKMGYKAGLMVGVSLPFLSITPEVWFIQNRFNITESSLMGGTASVKSNLIDVPVIVGLKILPFIQFEVGPRFNIYDNSTAKLDASGEKVKLNDITPTTGYVAGLKFTIVKKIVLGARFNGNFGRQSTTLIDNGTPIEIGNHSYSIMAGYKF